MMPLENRHAVFAGLATAADRLGYEAVGLPESWRANLSPEEIDFTLDAFRPMLGPER